MVYILVPEQYPTYSRPSPPSIHNQPNTRYMLANSQPTTSFRPTRSKSPNCMWSRKCLIAQGLHHQVKATKKALVGAADAPLDSVSSPSTSLDA